MSWKKYIVLLLLSLCAVLHSNAGEALIPYRKGTKWGLCTKGRKTIIPATYKEIFFLPPYYFATDANDKLLIFGLDGKKLGNCDDFDRVTGTDSFLVWRETDLNSEDNVSGPFHHSFNAYEKGYDLWLLHNDRLNKLTDGAIIASLVGSGNNAFQEAQPDIFFVVKGHKTGVYHLARNTWIIPPAYDQFIVPEGNRIIAFNGDEAIKVFDYNGKEFPAYPHYKDTNICQIFEDGNFLRVSPNSPETAFPKGKKRARAFFEIVAAAGNILQNNLTGIEVFPKHQLILAGTTTSANIRNLYNSRGELLMEDIRSTDRYNENVLAFTDQNDRLKALYNTNTKDFIWRNTFPDAISVSLDGDAFPGIETVDSYYVLNNAGQVLMSYDRRKESDFTVKRIYHVEYKKPDGTIAFQRFLALRSSKNEKFRYYDEQYQELKSIDSMLPAFGTSVIAYSKNGKWVVADHLLQPLTETYDSIRYTYSYKNFMLFKEGKQYIYLVQARRLLPATGYDDGVGYAHHNAFLGLKYGTVLPPNQSNEQYTSANCQVDLLDAGGNVQYSMHNNDQAYFNIDYQLTANNLIVATGEYTRAKYSKITDTKNAAKKFEQPAGLLTDKPDYHKMPVLFNWYDPAREKTEILSAASFNPVPFEKPGPEDFYNRLFYRYAPKDFVNGSNIIRTIEVTEIREKRNPNYRITNLGQEERVRTEIVIGYISLDGTCYFD